MKINKSISSFLIYILLFFFSSCEKESFSDYQNHITQQFGYPTFYSFQNNYIVDLCLIYQGMNHTMEYNTEQFSPYVFNGSGGNLKWMFDGFLFIELSANGNRHFGTTANKADWEWLIKKQLLTPSIGVPALNSVLDSLKSVNQTPLRKRKVVITIPGPTNVRIDWGEIDGKTLDMSKNGDRIKSVKWFIDSVLETWKANDFSELEFSGFYWLHEGESTNIPDKEILPVISQYIKSKGLFFYWIPYFGAPIGGGDWKKFGFDIAYQQPNYFFRHKDEYWPATRLNDACQFASKYNMGLEMEFDQTITDTLYQRRFREYLEYFDKNRVLELSPIAHYENRGTMYMMSKANDEVLKNLFDQYADVIIKRQNSADSIHRKIMH